MSVKSTPKSCSCQHCKRGKNSSWGHFIMKYDERKFRHSQKIALNQSRGGYSAAPIGNYYD